MFGRKEPKKDSAAEFSKAIDKAIAEARSAGISASSLMSRLEAAAESLRFAAHNESEQRRMATSGAVAVNEVWFQKEKARLIKAGEWPK
jgi:hypothetical protein